MIVIDATKPGLHQGKRVTVDDDRAMCVHFDGSDGYIITAENGQQRTRMGLTTEAAKALWFALGAALEAFDQPTRLPVDEEGV